MRRRKLLISIGALGAGGTAAFGTEAFTSVEAERNVDVEIAGDQSAFVAIQPLESDNAEEYVNTESDQTVELNLDGDNTGPGEGVNQDAITQVEDLFKIVNQGSQEASVFFEDESDAVTFRVTRSTSTDTQGSNGQTLEGADNSVELSVGEQVVVGLTVDTLENDVSGQLLDSVTLRADASASAPEQSIPEPQYVVTSNPSGGNEFDNVQSAISAAEPNSVIGIDGAFSSGSESSLSIESAINADTEGITLTGFDGTPEINATGSDLDTRDGGIVQIEADDVTLQNFDLRYADDRDDGATNGIEIGSGASVSTATIDGVGVTNDVSKDEVDENGAINLETGDDLTVTNCTVEGGAIGTNAFRNADVEVTISGNSVDLNPENNARAPQGGPTEGIFAFGGDMSSGDLEIRDNEVVNAPTNEEDIKVIRGRPATLNGEADLTSQVESLTRENDVSQVQVNGQFGSKVTPQDIGSGSRLASVSDVLKPDSAETSRTSAVVALFEEDGTYGPYTQSEDPADSLGVLDRADTLIQGLSGTPTIEFELAGLRGADGDLSFQGVNTTVENVRFEVSKDDNKVDNTGGEPLIGVSGKDTSFENAELAVVRPFGGNIPAYMRIGTTDGDSVSFSDGSITFDGCTFSHENADGSFTESPANGEANGQFFLSSNFLFGGSNNTVEVRNSTFRGVVRLDANLNGVGAGTSGSNNTIRVTNNIFEEENSSEKILGSGGTSGGTVDIRNNDFKYALNDNGKQDIKFSDTPNSVNGTTDPSEQEAANRLAKGNEASTDSRGERSPVVKVNGTSDDVN